MNIDAVIKYETGWNWDSSDLSGDKAYSTSISILSSVPKLIETHINIYLQFWSRIQNIFEIFMDSVILPWVLGQKSAKDFCRKIRRHMTEVKNGSEIFLNQILNQVVKFKPDYYSTQKQVETVENDWTNSATGVLICTVVFIWIGNFILPQSIRGSDQTSPLLYENNIPHQVIRSKRPIYSQSYLYKHTIPTQNRK